MATIGLEGFYTAEFSESSAGLAYASGKKVRKAVDVDINWEKNEAKLYADNAIGEKAVAIKEGTIKFSPDAIDDDIKALTGIKKESITVNGKEVEMFATKVNNQGKYVGFAYILNQLIDGEYSYLVKIIPKCQFTSADSESNKTQGENLEFSTPSINGTAFTDMYGNYIYEDTYETHELAQAAIESFLNITAA